MLVENILQSNKEMSQQLAQLKKRSNTNATPDYSRLEPVEQYENPKSDSITTVDKMSDTASPFEKDLFNSRVYMRAMTAKSDLSLPLSVGNSTTASLISSTSLADVSDIFALPLPIITEEIWNHRHYSAAEQASVQISKVNRSQYKAFSMMTTERRVPLTHFPNGTCRENGKVSRRSKKVMLLGMFMIS